MFVLLDIVTFNEPSYIVNEADITLVLAVKVNKKIAKDIHMTFLYNGLIATGKLWAWGSVKYGI